MRPEREVQAPSRRAGVSTWHSAMGEKNGRPLRGGHLVDAGQRRGACRSAAAEARIARAVAALLGAEALALAEAFALRTIAERRAVALRTRGSAFAGFAVERRTLAAFAVSRYRFFGRETISFLVILPLALPGIVTGMALNATFREVLGPFGIGLGLFTVIVGHATFCIVVVFNNVAARLRRTSTSFEEASADLGATTSQTFRYVTFPQLRSALIAGALLAFALSFDEVIVTTFTAGAEQTLPLWILTNLSRPNQLPIVNVVGVLVIVLSLIPVYVAQRLTRDPVGAAAGGR